MLVSCCEVRAVDYGFLVANKKGIKMLSWPVVVAIGLFSLL
jgi:hypothetical protein